MSVGKKLRFEVFKRDGFACQYCGKRPPDVLLEVDHVVPRCEGGKDDIANLTTACFACNRGKAGNGLGEVAPHLDEIQVLEGIQEMMERRANLKAQVAAESALEEATDAAYTILQARWNDEFHWHPHFDMRPVRPYLRSLGLTEVAHALDIAFARKGDSLNREEMYRYFLGVCKGMAKAKEDAG